MARPSDEVAAVRALSRLQVLPARRRARRSAAGVRDRRRTSGWGWRQNIVGLGVAIKRVRGRKAAGEPCVTLFVRRKLPKARLHEQEIVPERLELDTARGSVLTDIVVVGGRPVAHTARVRPLQPGAEIGHSRGGRGTLGLLVRKVGTREVLALSCSHVLALSGRLFDDVRDVEQPVPDGGDDGDDVVGRLTDDFSRLRSGAGAQNRDDVALARLTVPASPRMLGSGVTPLTASPREAHQFPDGLRTVLNGMVTQDAHGHVVAREVTFTIGEMPFVNGSVPFTGLVAYETRCARGDSGAAVMEAGESRVLGIHTAGISETRFGLFQPIGPILRRLGIELVTS